MDVTLRKTPGSIGGGVALPGFGGGMGGGRGRLRGESGGERSRKLRSRIRLVLEELFGEGGMEGILGSAADSVAGSRLSTNKDSSSSIGSCSQGPYLFLSLTSKEDRTGKRRRTW